MNLVAVITISDECGSVGESEIEIIAPESPAAELQSPSENPVVASGIISSDLASISFPVEEEILSGRRRPLRISSKARVMTSDEVRADLESQIKAIKNKGQETAPRKIIKQEKKDDVIPSTSRNKRPRQSSEDDFALEDSICLICGRDWAADRVPIQAM
jgi:hypothetical protein